jgi:hypothetical protein
MSHRLLHAAIDCSIFLCYYAIPLQLFRVLRQLEQQLPEELQTGLRLFMLFIGACGLGHLFNALELWLPLHSVTMFIHLYTAAISAGTAIALPKLVKRLYATWKHSV